MSDNVKLITYMKCQNITMTAYRDVGTILRKHPKNGVFTHLGLPRFSFKNRALSLLYPHGDLRENQCTVSEVFKDGLTDGQADEHG